MANAQSPLLFIISEPVGSPIANEVAHRLGERGVRTWIGSLAPAGELKDSAMEAMRGSAAALLIFDEAAANSRHVDRHLLVARQSGKPLIPLRIESTQEGLLRQELLDAQWVDGSSPEAAIEEISRRAFDYDRAQRERAHAGGAVGAAGAAGAAVAGSAAAAGQTGPRIQVLGGAPVQTALPEAAGPRIQVLGTPPAPPAAAHAPQNMAPPPVAAPPRRKSPFASPTMLLALLAVLAIVGAILYNSSLFQGGGDREDREVAENREPADDPVDQPDEKLTTYPLPSAENGTAAPPAAEALPPTGPAFGAAPAAAPEAGPERQEIASAEPPAAAAEAPAVEEGGGGGAGGVATVRAFYSALSRGDGASAAQHVVPGKRQSGPLSAAQLSRYYSSFRRPLRIREMTAVDDNTVRVAYDYVLGDGRTCRGEATVNVVQSGGRALVGSINTRGPC